MRPLLKSRVYHIVQQRKRGQQLGLGLANCLENEANTNGVFGILVGENEAKGDEIEGCS